MVVSEIREAQPTRCADITIGAGLTAVADQGLMMLVLGNLIGNAWKFTAGTENACIEFGATDRDDETVYFVRDNGVGFDPQYAKNMFKPFHRLHSESEFEGTGIGLSIVERIISRHSGQVWADGVIGKGATVFFILPHPESTALGRYGLAL
jgi:light-regulated signal transduction histidine kinase (bacteriophytochrome)